MTEKDTTLTEEDLLDIVLKASRDKLEQKVEQVGEEQWQPFERAIMLQSIDTQWRSHLLAMDHLRQGIHLRGYAQRDPRQEYKREAFELFAEMLDRIRDEVVKVLLTVRIRGAEETEQTQVQPPTSSSGIHVRYQHADYDAALGQGASVSQGEQAVAQAALGAGAAATAQASGSGTVPRVGRDAPCPCGSGKKYKHCHGKLT